MKTAARVLACVLATLGSGCGDDSLTPTSPTLEFAPPIAIKLFTGTLTVKGFAFYSFSNSIGGSATATLASLSAGGPAAVTTPVGLALGIPAGTGCAPFTSVTARPGLAPQITMDLAPGTYCVNVFDPGTLTANLSFAVRIVHP